MIRELNQQGSALFLVTPGDPLRVLVDDATVVAFQSYKFRILRCAQDANAGRI